MIESSRRGFITGLIAFAATAPAIVRAANIMSVKSVEDLAFWQFGDNLEVYGRSPMMDALPDLMIFMNPPQYKWFKLHGALPTNAVLVNPISTDGWAGMRGR